MSKLVGAAAAAAWIEPSMVMSGGVGDDFVGGASGDDTLSGGDGDDTLHGARGDDVLSGGAGKDLFIFVKQRSETDGVVGDDVITDFRVGEDRLGVPYDRFTSAKISGLDTILTYKGGTIRIVGVHDLSLTDWNNMIGAPATPPKEKPVNTAPSLNLVGGAGDDRLIGQDGDDFLSGMAGRDTLIGGAGDDRILGVDGDDELQGGDGDDILYGGAGNDIVIGGAGSDELWDEGGDDTFTGGAGQDVYYFILHDGTPAGGFGANTITDFDRTQDLFYMMTEQFTAASVVGDDTVLSYRGGTVRIAGVNDLSLAQWNELRWIGYDKPVRNQTLTGDDGENSLVGQIGEDTLSGLGGNDFLSGMGGHDLLQGGSGDDRLLGGDGDDELWGEDGDDILIGESGDDFAAGGAGNDAFFDSAGDDTYSGGAGADVFSFIPSMQTPAGGMGDDVINDFDLSVDILDTFTNVIKAATVDGADTVLSYVGGTIRIVGINTLSLDEWNELRLQPGTPPVMTNQILEGGAGRDTLYGGRGDDVLSGKGDNDFIVGNGGGDRLLGGEGDDRLLGGRGDDVIEGGSGDDWLYGEEGEDVLIGGGGRDRFLLDQPLDRNPGWAGHDVILDFDLANDRFDTLSKGFLSATIEGDDTLLTYTGGTALVKGVTGLSLAQWNALEIGGGF